jgi:hypothetical protein
MAVSPRLDAAGLDIYLGKWKVDYEASLAAAKSQPEYDSEEDALVLPRVLRTIAEKTVLEIAPGALTFTMGEKGTPISYKVKSDRDGRVVLDCKSNGREFTLTLEPRSKGRMNMQSSASDSMDYYVWTPLKAGDGKDR